MKITLKKEKLIGFKVLNIKSIKNPQKNKKVLLQGVKIGKGCMVYSSTRSN